MRSIFLFLVVFTAGCGAGNPIQQVNDDLSWDDRLKSSKGATVRMMMWQGDPLINRYMKTYVAPKVKEELGITLELISGQGNQIVTSLMSEMEAGKDASEIDLVWINGETFFQLRQLNALYGPFVDQLPNAEFIDLENPFIGIDFQQPVDGYECPWGNVQLTLIYDEARLPSPPRNLQELRAFVKEHPGVFTIGTEFTGMTFLKSLLVDLAGENDFLNGAFDAEKYDSLSTELWQILREMKPFLWKEGKTFPSSVAQMHQLFVNGELWITMSNNDSEADNKVLQGLFPESTKAYLLESGTIQNSHYLGIPAHAVNPSASMAVINCLISAEAQYEKMKPSVWGDGTVLNTSRLPEQWQKKFAEVPGRLRAPNRANIDQKAIMEPAPEYMLRLYEDFRTKVIESVD